ncbi:hypothetical protein [Streptomyces sp. NBC_01506]|uniref:hypothetical protein n=1 Tax=Streptomyces sp. NBC_01506 TaxID=2903887 RepID=UPI0038647833
MNSATIQLAITNTYFDGAEIETSAIITVPVPYPIDPDEREEWAYEHIFPETGTGRDGDAWYEAEVVASTDSELTGKTFEFGG